MNQPHVLIDANEMASVVMKFIGTEKFDEIVSAIDNNAKAGFMVGLSFALSLGMAECKTFLYHVEEQSKEDKAVKRE